MDDVGSARVRGVSIQSQDVENAVTRLDRFHQRVRLEAQHDDVLIDGKASNVTVRDRALRWTSTHQPNIPVGVVTKLTCWAAL